MHMNMFRFLKGLVLAFLIRIFPGLSYKGVVDTLIKCYLRARRAKPEMSEDEVLNLLIRTRVEAPPRVATKEQELTHYEPLLQKVNKSLEEVIFAVVEYEHISSRTEELFHQLSTMNFSPDEILKEIENQKAQAREYIRERIAEL